MSAPEDQAQALLRLAETLERAARQLRALAGDASVAPRRKAGPLPEGFVDGLRSAGRATAAEQLAALSQIQLGAVFAQLGGPSRDKKRSKDWLVERILWYLFDFQSGHDIIKGAR